MFVVKIKRTLKNRQGKLTFVVRADVIPEIKKIHSIPFFAKVKCGFITIKCAIKSQYIDLR